MKQELLPMRVFVNFFSNGLFASRQFRKMICSHDVICIPFQTLLLVRPALEKVESYTLFFHIPA